MNDDLQNAQKPAQNTVDAEQAACAQQPAVAVNRYHIAAGKNHVRIAFMELLHPHGWCRAAVVMDRKDAISLANSLALVLSEGTEQ